MDQDLLVLSPALAAHDIAWAMLEKACIAAIAFSLCASGNYIVNDILDAPADRLDPVKKSRPAAACLGCWLGRMIYLAYRGKLHGDPVLAGLTDWISVGLGLCFGLALENAI